MILEIFQYDFIQRGFEAGLIIAFIAPLIGIFLVLRRYSLIADTLSHVSLSGIALAVFTRLNPVLMATIITVIFSILIEKLRQSKKIYGESVLSLFLSGSLAFAVITLSLKKNMASSIFNYLFGSIATVTSQDIVLMSVVSLTVLVLIAIFYKELVFTSFDEESAKASGVPVKFVNIILIVISALTISLAIPVVGVLLTSALIVIPVITALLFKKSFLKTIFLSEIISILSVGVGIFFSFYLNISASGVIVMIMIAIFSIVYLIKK